MCSRSTVAPSITLSIRSILSVRGALALNVYLPIAKYLPKIIVIERPLNKEEIVHDKRVNLCQLINRPREGVDGEVVLHVEVVNQSKDIDKDIHADVHRVPRINKRLYIKLGMKLRA